MAELVKCPQCQGVKTKELGNGKYRCLYCGATFTIENKDVAEQPAQQQAPSAAPQIVYIQQPSAQPQNPLPEKKSTTTTGFKVFIAVVALLLSLSVLYFLFVLFSIG